MNAQLLVNAINNALGNYGRTLDMSMPSMLRQGTDNDQKAFISDVSKGEADVVMIYGCNPVYDSPLGFSIAEALKKVDVCVSFADSMDETSAVCHYICPDSHYLESWNDAEPVKGCYSLAQPAIRNLFDTRQAQDSLLAWCGASMSSMILYGRNLGQWSPAGSANMTRAFNQALQTGLFQMPMEDMGDHEMMYDPQPVVMNGDVSSAAAAVLSSGSKMGNGLEVTFYESVAIGDGRYANNPWLQEMPDPVSKITWDNYLNVSPEWAEK